MKKFISLLLALVLVLSLSTVAFAYEDHTEVDINVTYTLIGDGSSPAESFTVTHNPNKDASVVDGDAASAPALGAITPASFTEGAATATGATGTINVKLPECTTVGKYKYVLHPVVGNTAGVSYHATDIILYVTYLNDKENGEVRVAAVHTENPEGSKVNGINYEYSAGKLNVTKNVTGNLGDKTKAFNFTITLAGDTEHYTYANKFVATVTDGVTTRNVDMVLGENSIALKNGETVSIANLPYGVTYAVDEADYSNDGYTTTGEVTTATAIAEAAANVTVTNNKEGEVDTGVMLDSLPYILVLAFVAVAGTALILKKRANV